MSVSLPLDKLADIQQVALSLLQTQPGTVCQVMFTFLGKANFCASGHLLLQQLCHVIQNDMLTVYHSPTQLLSSVYVSFSALHQQEQLSHLQQSPFPLHFLFPNLVITTDATSSHLAVFIFRVLDCHYQLVDPGQVLCVGLILPGWNFRQLP